MKEEFKKPFLPYVSLEGVEDFDINRPETHRYSPLVNAVLEAFHSLHPVTGKKVAEYLDLPFSAIVGTLRTETGMSYTEFYEHWLKRRIIKTVRLHPDCSTEQLAMKIGLGNRSTLWKFLHKHKMVKEPGRGDYEPRNCILKLLRDDLLPANEQERKLN